ncbi:MAG: hypothetical protein AMXMBFR58_23540 [Phycisphaerae bacterium]
MMRTPVNERGGVAGAMLLVLRVALGALFLLAAYVKLSDPQGFSESVRAFKILPDHLAQLATFAVPWTEGVCGVCLVVGLWTRSAAGVVTALLLVFIAGIASVLWRGLSVHCGCFGKLQPFCSGPLGACNILQNAVMALVGFALMAWGGGVLSMDRRTVRVLMVPSRAEAVREGPVTAAAVDPRRAGT